MPKKHVLYSIKLSENPTCALDDKKYKGLKKELLLKNISFSDSNNICNNRGQRSLCVVYPTFIAFKEGESSENSDNSEECTNKLREIVSNSDVKPENITLSKWQQHSLRKDEYILIRSQSAKEGIIYTEQIEGEVISFVLQSSGSSPMTSKKQTNEERIGEKNATHVTAIAPTNNYN